MPDRKTDSLSLAHVGYARVSTLDQDPTLQLDGLAAAGCAKVFEDRASGARADRPGLQKALEYAREGDVLIVWKLDRLGRSVKHLVDLAGELHKLGVQFMSVTDSIDTGTPSGRFFFHVMARMERELIVERTRAGLDVAKQLGRKGGRKPKMTDSKIESAKKLLANGVPPKDVARISVCPFRRCTAGCQPQRTLSVRFCPFSLSSPPCPTDGRRPALVEGRPTWPGEARPRLDSCSGQNRPLRPPGRVSGAKVGLPPD